MSIINPTGGSSSSRIASGTYTGDSSHSRQITTGFKCREVIITDGVPDAVGSTYGTLVIGKVTWLSVVNTGFNGCGTDAGLICHASDGFIVGKVSGTEYSYNVAASVYDYIAFGEV